MNPIYWHQTTEDILAPFRTVGRAGLVTDMDGTISHFAEDPHAATVTPDGRARLRQLTDRLALVAVVSGRSVTDVREKVGLDDVRYYGNHGLERWVGDAVRIAPGAAAFRPQLASVLDALTPPPEPGMLVEDKGATLSIHYRRTADPPAARDRLLPELTRIAAGSGLKLFEGHRVFEIRPPVEIDKGTAFRELVTGHRLEAALYIGDDTTDAAALRAARQLRGEGRCYAVGVGVVSDSTPESVLESADLLAEGVGGVESLLAWLVEARMASST